MFRRLNIYYILSAIMLFVMMFIFFRITQVEELRTKFMGKSSAHSLIEYVEGEFGLFDASIEDTLKQTMAWITIEQVDTTGILKITVQSADTTRTETDHILLLVNDFENDQVLVEWFLASEMNHESLLDSMRRVDECELLFKPSVDGFYGNTLGDFCYPDFNSDHYSGITVNIHPTIISIQIITRKSEDDHIISRQNYELRKHIRS